MKIVILKAGERKAISTKNFLKKYDPLLRKICSRWQHSFYFDKAITSDDLLQDLRIKLLNDLHHYDLNRGSLFTFVKRVANNFFINKRLQLIISDRYPVDCDKTLLTIKSLYQATMSLQYEEPDYDSQFEIIMDTLKSEELSPEDNLEYNALIENVRHALNKVKYTPRHFIKRRRSFVLKVFDLLYGQNKKLYEQILFDHRCKMRCYDNYALSKRPNKIFPRASSIANSMGVDIRTVNKALKIIRQTIEVGGNGKSIILTTEGKGYGESVRKKERFGPVRRTPYKKAQEIQT